MVAHTAECGGASGSTVEVGGTTVGRVSSDNAHKSDLDLGHLGLDLRGGEGVEVGMGPGVGADLVAGVIGFLNGGAESGVGGDWAAPVLAAV